MNKKNLFFFYILFISAFLSKDTHANDTFLFSFEKDNQKSYLVGSLHGLEAMRLPPKLLSFVNERSALVLENMDIQNPLNTASLVDMGVLKDPTDQSFSLDMFEKEDANELLRYVNPFLLEKGNYVQANQLNLKGLYAAYIGGHFLNGLDYWLLRSFQQNQKEILGLETRKDISGFFEDLTFENLEGIIKHRAGFDSPEALKIEEDYLMGVIPNEESTEPDEEMKTRNLAWLEKLTQYHEKYSQEMIATVGLYHLFGEYGLLKLLANNGFILKRMNDSGEFSVFNL